MDITLETGFLEAIDDLTIRQIEQACEVAHTNARDLLAEADILHAAGHSARAYFLAHVACEEVAKLPILITAAVAAELGYQADWRRIDKRLREHSEKTKQALFMDSLVGGKSLLEGQTEYEADLKRLRTYLDLKNAALYSAFIGGEFVRPSRLISPEFFEPFRDLAGSRVDAFESMYLQPIRSAEGLAGLLSRANVSRVRQVLDALTGPEGAQAFERYRQSGDESELRAWIDSTAGWRETIGAEP